MKNITVHHNTGKDVRHCPQCQYETSLITSQVSDFGVCPLCHSPYPAEYHHVPDTQPGDTVKLTSGVYREMIGVVVTVGLQVASVNLDYGNGYTLISLEHIKNITRPTKVIDMDETEHHFITQTLMQEEQA